jgi:hypothetical protein
MPNVMRVAVVAGALVAFSGGQAGAATTVGQVAPNPGVTGGCAGATTFLTPAVAPATPSYVIPADGVLTSWSMQGDDSVVGSVELKVVRPLGGTTFQVTAEDPAPHSIPINVLSTFSTRIAVTQGDLLALWVPTGTSPCVFQTGNASDTLNFKSGSHPEPAPSDSFATNGESPGHRLNLSALIEPDADRDGFGDETQDQCPDAAAFQAPPCDRTAPETTITKGPKAKTKKPKAKFAFSSSEASSTFQCRLKGKGLDPALTQFTACASPRKYTNLDSGKYRFFVFATDATGNADATPAKHKFKIVG